MYDCLCGHQHLTFFGTYGAGAPDKRFAKTCAVCGCEDYHEKLHDVCVPLEGCSLGPGETVGLDGAGIPVDQEPVHPESVLEAVRIIHKKFFIPLREMKEELRVKVSGECRCGHVHISEACGECGIPPCLHYVAADLDLTLLSQPERKPLGVI